jgi:hypothetical protein
VVQLDKALYGTLEAAKLWYDNLTSKFLQAGFVKNPYDECVWNKTMLNGQQVTVTFHVDDLVVTCEDAKANTTTKTSLFIAVRCLTTWV